MSRRAEVLLVLLVSTNAAAQSSSAAVGPPPIVAPAAHPGAVVQNIGSSPEPLGVPPGLLTPKDPDPTLLAADRDYQLARYHYWSRALDQRGGIIDRTNQIGVLIFGVVHLILIIGLVMSWREFQRAAAIRSGAEKQEEATEMKLSLEGLALKTSLHGAVLLGFALAFYFLYLKFVYPISVVPS